MKIIYCSVKSLDDDYFLSTSIERRTISITGVSKLMSNSTSTGEWQLPELQTQQT